MRGKELRKTQGITLIALVITIIVLLILAGVSVSMLSGNNGVLQKATDAKQANSEAEDLEKVQLATQAALADGLGKIDLEDTDSSAKTKGSLYEALIEEFGEDSDVVTEYASTKKVKLNGKEYEVTINGAVQEVNEETLLAKNNLKILKENEITNINLKNNNNISKVITEEVPIPKGYTYMEGTKDTGLVIKDSNSNEYVWVPVEDATDMTENVGLCTYYDKDSNKDKYLTTAGFSSATEMETKLVSDFNEMKASVAKYKGFYIGRYELTAEGEKSGAPLVKTNWYGLYAKCKGLTQANTNTEVRMVWNSQWNKIMTWMENIQNPNVPGKKFTEDSTGMGNYDTSGTINTGSNEAYKVKNIYDLAGNCVEWTQEAYDTFTRAYRGGFYYSTGSFTTASFRDGGYPVNSDCDDVSSRATLYIK